MASLVEPLAVGYAAAPSGTAEFYRQGTSTLQDVYSDAEAVTAVTSHALDSSGRIVRYVKGRTDVVVKNVSGATVATFTFGGDAREVRVENAGFTGTLASGATGAGGRTTVDEVLTRALTSFGTTDWQVLVNGTATNLSTAVSSFSGVLFNVKTYGALGNDTAEDLPAINLTIAAAQAAGGGIVYFPAGTYKITPAGSIDLTAAGMNITFMGAADAAVTIKCYSNAINGVFLTGEQPVNFQNITFSYSSAAFTGQGLFKSSGAGKVNLITCTINCHSDQVFVLGATSEANLYGCRINVSRTATVIGAGAVRSILRFHGVTFYVSSTGSTLFTTGWHHMLGCTVSFSGNGLTFASGASSNLFMSGCFFNNVLGIGTVTVMSAGTLVATGNQFTGSGGSTSTLVTLAYLYEAGNQLNSFTIGTIPVAAGTLVSTTRDLGFDESTTWSTAASSYTPSALKRNHYIALTYNVGASSYTINAPTNDPGASSGLVIQICIYNSSSFGHAINWNATFSPAPSLLGGSATLGATSFGTYTFFRGATGWRLLGVSEIA